jgi:hypothetical protein
MMNNEQMWKKERESDKDYLVNKVSSYVINKDRDQVSKIID